MRTMRREMKLSTYLSHVALAVSSDDAIYNLSYHRPSGHISQTNSDLVSLGLYFLHSDEQRLAE